MRYTQKDIREKIGISRDALRLYEKRGIIAPEVDPANGYRYYDDWQINLLWECKSYQGMGFSLSEVQDILQKDSLAALEGRMDGRIRELRRELAQKELVLRECERQREELAGVEAGLGRFELVDCEERVFVPMREMHDLVGGNEAATVSSVIANMPLERAFCVFPSLGEDRYFWGYAIRTSENECLERPVPREGGVLLPACKALSTCVDAGERWGFGLALFAGLVAEAERRGLVPAGGIFGALLARTHEENGYHRYVRAYLPLA